MNYTEATDPIKRLPLLPVRPSSYPAPPPRWVKQATAWLTCRQNARGKRRCGHDR